MKVLITGANGQLGWELQRTTPDSVEIVPLSSADLDITDPDRVNAIVASHKPGVIVNAAAYTAVDKAEQEAERAFAVNADGAANVARASQTVDARLVHISTDFVFDGKKSRPYLPDDVPNPAGVYGKSKLLGEKNLLEITSGVNATILRTAWVYSSHGNNFVKTMLRLMAERDALGVVADQIGTPTWANTLARSVWSVIEKNLHGIFHCTDAGVASWYDFAVAIYEEGQGMGLLDKSLTIKALRTEEYPTPAKRPPFSVMDKTSLWDEIGVAPHWRTSLRNMLKELKNE